MARADTSPRRDALRRRAARRRLGGDRLQGAQRPRPGRGQRPGSASCEAAERLSFSPNPLARGLLAGRTGTVGLLTSDLEGRFVIPILMGAEDAFGAGKVNVFLCDARGDAIREQYHLRALLSRRVDGLIVVGRQTDPRPSLGPRHPASRSSTRTPRPTTRPTCRSRPTTSAPARIAVEHLIACGRTRIAHITGEPAYAAARDRADGRPRRRCTPAGLELVGDVMFSEWSEGWGRDAAAVLLARHPDIDAILCGSDQIARGVLDTARDLRRTVPDDLAVMGFDNWEVLTTNSRPELTSIDANLQQLGRTAAQRVFAALDGVDTGSGTEYVAGRLVIRGSTVAKR